MHAAVFLLGRMGSGKTTISHSLGLARISAGDVSRALGPIGLTNDGLDPREGAIQRGIEAGIVHGLHTGDVVVDGFPRQLGQLQTALDACNGHVPMFVHVQNRHWLRNLTARRRMDDVEQEIQTAHQQIGVLSALLHKLRTDSCAERFHVFKYDNRPPVEAALEVLTVMHRLKGGQ